MAVSSPPAAFRQFACRRRRFRWSHAASFPFRQRGRRFQLPRLSAASFISPAGRWLPFRWLPQFFAPRRLAAALPPAFRCRWGVFEFSFVAGLLPILLHCFRRHLHVVIFLSLAAFSRFRLPFCFSWPADLPFSDEAFALKQRVFFTAEPAITVRRAVTDISCCTDAGTPPPPILRFAGYIFRHWLIIFRFSAIFRHYCFSLPDSIFGFFASLFIASYRFGQPALRFSSIRSFFRLFSRFPGFHFRWLIDIVSSPIFSPPRYFAISPPISRHAFAWYARRFLRQMPPLPAWRYWYAMAPSLTPAAAICRIIIIRCHYFIAAVLPPFLRLALMPLFVIVGAAAFAFGFCCWSQRAPGCWLVAATPRRFFILRHASFDVTDTPFLQHGASHRFFGFLRLLRRFTTPPPLL